MDILTEVVALNFISGIAIGFLLAIYPVLLILLVKKLK